MGFSVWPAPEDSGVVGPGGPTGPAGSSGPAGTPGIIQTVNTKTGKDVVLTYSDVKALPNSVDATLNASRFSINDVASKLRMMTFATAGTDRWQIQVDGSGEPGLDAGSDFRLSARHDDGTFNVTSMYVKRLTGQTAFGAATLFGSSMVTSAGPVGLRDVAADPATVTGGVYLYSKGGVPFFKTANGASFQVMPGNAPVTQVNGQIGNVVLGAADVEALSTNSGGRVDGPIVVNGQPRTNRDIAFATGSKRRWSIRADDSPEGLGVDGGSDLNISAHSDGGAETETFLHMRRGVGQTIIGGASGVGSAKLSVAGALGISNTASIPATGSSGAQLYAQNGNPFVLRGDGSKFEIVDGIRSSAAGAPSGVATLDSKGKVPTSQLPPGQVYTGPKNIWTPESLGFQAWSADPATVSNPQQGTTGSGEIKGAVVQRVYYAGFNITEPTTVNRLVIFARGWAGSSAVPGTRFTAGIYNETGARVAWTGQNLLGAVPGAGAEAGTPSDARNGHVGSVPFFMNASTTLQPGRYWGAFLVAAGTPQDFYYVHIPNWAVSNPSNFHLLGTAFMRAGYIPGQTALAGTIDPSTMKLDHDPMIMALA